MSKTDLRNTALPPDGQGHTHLEESQPVRASGSPGASRSLEDDPDAMELDGGKSETVKKGKSQAKETAALVREPGKSLLPFSRVQKILKADKELPMVAREAVFLISVATEEFVKGFAQAGQRAAEREKRTTVQERDIATVVRKADEYVFLEELMTEILGTSEESQGRRKPRALREREEKGNGHPTMLDRFVVARKDDGLDDQGDVLMNEDGTMSVDPRTF